MITFGRIFMMLGLLVVFLYTTSYGIWVWKKKNPLGAVMIFILAITIIVLPAYSIFFTGN